MENKKLWYAVMTDSTDEWGNGTFDFDEAVEMCNSRPCYTMIAAIDAGYDEEGNEHKSPFCVECYVKYKDFDGPVDMYGNNEDDFFNMAYDFISDHKDEEWDLFFDRDCNFDSSDRLFSVDATQKSGLFPGRHTLMVSCDGQNICVVD